MYALRADFDDSYKAYSPGKYLEHHIIRHVFEQGYREYNAGPGMNLYKMQWTNKLKRNLSLLGCNTSPRGMYVWLLEKHLVPLARKAGRRKERPPGVRHRGAEQG